MKKVLNLRNFRFVSYAFAFAIIVAFAVSSAMQPTLEGIAQYDAGTSSDNNWGATIGGGIAGIGMIGAGIGQGYAAGKAAEAVGRNPEAEGKIRNIMIIGAAIAESSALYALVIAILAIFVG